MLFKLQEPDLSQLHTVVYVDDASEPDSKDVCCVNVNEWLKEGDSVGTLPPGPEEEDLAGFGIHLGNNRQTQRRHAHAQKHHE